VQKCHYIPSSQIQLQHFSSFQYNFKEVLITGCNCGDIDGKALSGGEAHVIVNVIRIMILRKSAVIHNILT